MLRLLFAALAAFDAYICIMRKSEREFKQFMNGVKPTLKNLFSKVADQLEGAAFNW